MTLLSSLPNQSGPLARPKCKVEDCCNPVRNVTRGLCAKHYFRLLKHGSTDVVEVGGQKTHRSPHVRRALAILEGYNASAPESAYILGVYCLTAARWAKRYGIVLRRDPPGQERFFSESRTHRAFVMRRFRG